MKVQIEKAPNYYIDENSVITNEIGKVINPYKDQLGYQQITLRVNKKPKHFRVHRLMADSFLHPTKEQPMVNHIDGNKENNNLSNLELCNNRENVQHAYNNGLYTDRRENHPINVHLKNNDNKIEIAYYQFKSIRQASEFLDLNRKRITGILKGEINNHTEYDFEYL